MYLQGFTNIHLIQMPPCLFWSLLVSFGLFWYNDLANYTETCSLWHKVQTTERLAACDTKYMQTSQILFSSTLRREELGVLQQGFHWVFKFSRGSSAKIRRGGGKNMQRQMCDKQKD